MKKTWVVSSLIFTAVLFYFNRPDRTPVDLNELVLPQCDSQQRGLATQVHFFVDSSLEGVYNPRHAKEQIEFSNLTLTNSCLPLKRELTHFEYVDLNLSNSEFVDDVYAEGREAIGKERLKPIQDDPLSFFVLVAPYHHPVFEDNTVGMTYWELSDSFILLSEDAGVDVLEHEFGHLMHANHSETLFFSLLQGQLERSSRPENRHLIKPYARAYKCDNAGTIMSYEEVTLPIYSSPEIVYRSEPCGNELHADNNRRVREYIAALKKRLAQTQANQPSA